MSGKTLTDADFSAGAAPQTLSDHDFAPGLANSVITPQVVPEELQGLQGTYHRFVAKGFGTNPKSMVDYLKERHPDLNMKYDPDAKNIVFFDKQGNPNGVLDPNTGVIGGAKEFAQDVAEGIPETAAGALGTAGSAIGGVGAGLLTEGNPLAIRGGASALGAVGNATGELGREAIGSALGLKDNFDSGEVGASALSGAIAPQLFGSGGGANTAKTLLKSGLIKNDIPKELLEKTLSGQSGLPMLAKDAVGNKLSGARDKLYSILSGIPKGDIETAAKNMATIKNMEGDKLATTKIGSQVIGDFGKIEEANNKTGADYARTVKDSGRQIPTANAVKPVQDKIAELEALQAKDPQDQVRQNAIDELRTNLERMFGKNIPETISPDVALDKAARLKDMANIKGAPGGQLLDRNANAQMATKETQNAFAGSRAGLKKDILEIPGAQALNDKYKQEIGFLNTFNNKTKDPNAAYNYIRGLGGKNNQPMTELAQKLDSDYGTSLVPTSNLSSAFETFRNPAKTIIPRTWDEIKKRGVGTTVGAVGGAYAGQKSGGWGGGTAGFVGGGGLGAGLSSPAALRYYLSNGPIRSFLGRNPATRSIPLSIWNLMKSEEAQNPNK